MSSPRANRVPERIREIVAELVASLKDPRIGFVTITDVRTTPDNGHATVYYTVLGSSPGATDAGDVAGGERTGHRTGGDALAAPDDEVRRRTAEGLASATSMLRRELGRRLRTRQTPSLEFVHDPVPDQGRRIEALLDEALRDR